MEEWTADFIKMREEGVVDYWVLRIIGRYGVLGFMECWEFLLYLLCTGLTVFYFGRLRVFVLVKLFVLMHKICTCRPRMLRDPEGEDRDLVCNAYECEEED